MSGITSIRTTAPVKTFSGVGANQMVGKLFSDMNLKKVLVVCDKGILATGLVDNTIKCINASGIETVLFDEVLPDPPTHVIDKAAEVYRENGCQGVIAVGGGSSIDTGKCVAMLQKNPGSMLVYASNPMIPRMKGDPMIAIPTTVGTGSEVTNGAVVTNSAIDVKAAMAGSEYFPDFAILDPLYVVGLPKSVIASTAMDAFSHSVEAMLSSVSNPMCEIVSLESIRLITKNLKKAMENSQDVEAMGNLLFASYLGGMSLNDGACNFGHAIAHTLGAKYHTAHGVLCALSLPLVLEFHAFTYSDKIRKIAEAMELNIPEGMGKREIAALAANEIRRLNKENGIPSFKEIGVTAEALPNLSNLIMLDNCVYVLRMTDPNRYFTADDFFKPLQAELARE